MNKNELPNILLVDKPKGITSFDVIRELRKKYKVRKMGHSGTLDPLASGLMIIGVGKGTKDLQELIKLPKVYEAEVLLGVKTTTGDREGEIIQRKEVKEVDIVEIERVLREMKGKLSLPVPFYSAVKVSGKKLYELARRGKSNVKLPIKQMEVFWIQLRGHRREKKYYVLDIELEVKSGTYIRSIAEELGEQLGFPASIKELRRTRIGEFKIEDAEKI